MLLTGRLTKTPFSDPEFSRRLIVIEYANNWLDGFKTFLVHYETSVGNWLVWNWLAFAVSIFAKKQSKPDFLNSFTVKADVELNGRIIFC